MKKIIFGILGIFILGVLVTLFGRWELYFYSGGLSSGHGGYFWSKGACMTAGELAVQKSPGSVNVGNWGTFVSKVDNFTCGIGCHGIGLDGHVCLIEK